MRILVPIVTHPGGDSIIYDLVQRHEVYRVTVISGLKIDGCQDFPIPTIRSDQNLSEYIDSVRDLCLKIITEHDIEIILPTPNCTPYQWMIGNFNEQLGLPGINNYTGRILTNKVKYLERIADFSPKIYTSFKMSKQTDVPSVPLPCILKPAWGEGGHGIFVCRDEYELKMIFDQYDYRYRTPGTELHRALHPLDGHRHYYISRLMDEYLIQEFVDGDVVSVAGRMINGELIIDLLYDLLYDRFPSRAVTGFVFPSKHHTHLETVRQRCQTALKMLGIDSGPVMLDLVVDSTMNFWIIDVAARMSLSGTDLIRLGGIPNYANACVNSLLGKNSGCFTPSHALALRYLPIPKGELKTMVLPSLKPRMGLNPPQGKWFMEERTSEFVATRGYVFAEGETRSEAVMAVDEFVAGCRFEVEHG